MFGFYCFIDCTTLKVVSIDTRLLKSTDSDTLHTSSDVINLVGVCMCVCYDFLLQAKERRDEKNPDYNAVEESLPSTSSYKAVAPAGFVDP